MMTFRDYVRVLFRHKAVVLATIAGVAMAAYVGLAWKTPIYEAQVKILISAAKQVEALYYRDLAVQRKAEIALTQSEIVQSNPVIERVVRALHLDERPLDEERQFASPVKQQFLERRALQQEAALAQWPVAEQQSWRFRHAVNALRQNVTVEPIRDADVLIIRAKAFSPMEAATLANTISRAYVIFDLEQQLAELQLKYGERYQTVRQIQDSIDRMTKHLSGETLPDLEAIGPASVKIIEQASRPMQPIGSSRNVLFGLTLAAGVGLGIILAFVFELLDQTVKSPQDLKPLLHVEPLSSIPKRKFWHCAVVKNFRRKTPYVSAFRALTDQIYLTAKARGIKTLLVTAPLAAEGSTTVMVNLARCLAYYAHQRVLIIDANLRAPSLHKLLRLKNIVGLTDVLQGRTSWEAAASYITPHVAVLAAGKPVSNPLGFLSSERMSVLLRETKDAFDFVILDCANTSDYQDSMMLAPAVDGLTLVIREGKARRQALEAALAPWRHMNGKIMGTILNGRTFAIPGFLYDLV
ncbi:MAG: lipopolysaccharide biosynthesis protein [Candidatus Omnitrophica bacterium]|nr:lipopolysaccharide biosynthesis protein [Candidatus Omnitrophota bacterium]